jgi:hypothetical protein
VIVGEELLDLRPERLLFGAVFEVQDDSLYRRDDGARTGA